MDITKEQVEEWLLSEQAKEKAEDERVYNEILEFARQNGRVVFAVVFALPDGSAAVPAWGVKKA